MLAALSVAVGCRTSGPNIGATETLRNYIDAVRSNRPKQAYALLDPSVRRQISARQFANQWSKLRTELEAQGSAVEQQLDGATARPYAIKSEIALSGFTKASLTFDTNSMQWQIDNHHALPLPPTATPAETLQALLRAFEQRDAHAVLSLLSDAKRASVEADIDQRVKLLRARIDDLVETKGNPVRLQLDATHRIELVREHGQWKVADF